MELFGLFVPFWVLFVGYVVGMPLIGFPLGKWSLKVWKNPQRYPLLGMFLFPQNAFGNRVGIVVTRDDDFGVSVNVDTTPAIDFFDIHNALQGNDPLPLAQYIAVQMYCWPFRIAYTMTASLAIIALSQLFLAPTYGAKLLMRCKRCVTID